MSPGDARADRALETLSDPRVAAATLLALLGLAGLPWELWIVLPVSCPSQPEWWMLGP